MGLQCQCQGHRLCLGKGLYIYVYMRICVHICEEFFSKTWSPIFALALQTRFLDLRLSRFGAELFIYIYIYRYLYVNIYTCVSMRICICVHLWMYAWAHIWMTMNECVNKCECKLGYVMWVWGVRNERMRGWVNVCVLVACECEKVWMWGSDGRDGVSVCM